MTCQIRSFASCCLAVGTFLILFGSGVSLMTPNNAPSSSLQQRENPRFARILASRQQRRTADSPSFLCSSSSSEESESSRDFRQQDSPPPAEEDWRAFRARLVQLNSNNNIAAASNDVNSGSSSTKKQADSKTTSSGGGGAIYKQDASPLTVAPPVTLSSANGSSSSASNNSCSTSSSWIYDSGTHIETGSLVVSQVESTLGCHDLRQPYFYKCVVLIIHHDLKEMTQGIILNRPSHLFLDDLSDVEFIDDDEKKEDDVMPMIVDQQEDRPDKLQDTNSSSSRWQIFFGGDISSLDSDEPMILCLHNNTSPEAMAVSSDPILPGLAVMSLYDAKEMIESGIASQDDFFLFGGCCSWDPGQLESEVERGSWYMVSIDERSLWNELPHLRTHNHEEMKDENEGESQQPATSTSDPIGLNFWTSLVEKLHPDDEAERSASHSSIGSFPELMLREWSRDRLLTETIEDLSTTKMESATMSAHEEATDDTTMIVVADEDIFRALKTAAEEPTTLKAGTVLQSGGSKEVPPFMLQEWFLHKSTVLTLQDTDNFTAAVILNLPTPDIYSLHLGDGTSANFTIRYGGPGRSHENDDDDDQENDDDETPMIWLHSNMGLKCMSIGKPLVHGDDVGIWTCSAEQVRQALDLGFCGAEEFMLVRGFCIWEKDNGAGGARGQVLAGNMDVINATQPSLLSDAWSSLLAQKPLTEDTREANFRLIQESWARGRNQTWTEDELDTSRLVDNCTTVHQLADQALQAWIDISLLQGNEFGSF